MKILIPLFVLFLSFDAAAQNRKTVRHSKLAQASANSLFADVKRLSLNQKQFCFDLLQKLDSADAVFSATKDSARFVLNVKRALEIYTSKIETLPEGKLKQAMDFVMLIYLDTGVLLELGEARANGEDLNLTEIQEENLGAIQRRYKTLLNIEIANDLLEPDNLGDIYGSAVKFKEGLYTFLQ